MHIFTHTRKHSNIINMNVGWHIYLKRFVQRNSRYHRKFSLKRNFVTRKFSMKDRYNNKYNTTHYTV